VTATFRPGGIDSLGMLEAALALPEQVEVAAAAVVDGVDGLPEPDAVSHVVVLGMGGSGIAGDVLGAVAAPFMPVPLIVCKDYELPGCVGDGSLVFAVSFSGNTEETVEAATEAASQGARIVAVCAGGELRRLATAWVEPTIHVSNDIPMPRAAIGALAVPPLLVLEQLGLFPGAVQWVALAVEQLKRRRDALAREGNEAQALARRLGRTIPLVYGGGAIGAVAAMRWKADFNENAKVPAFWNRNPELCHNEAAGWGQHGDVTRQVLSLVNLRHDHEHPQVVRRFDIVNALVAEVVGRVEEVRAEGDGPLAQLLDLVLFGDVTSLHLALQEGIDPGPIAALEQIKAALAD
jgi:glucose/mannose-6-phosphate isomerase